MSFLNIQKYIIDFFKILSIIIAMKNEKKQRTIRFFKNKDDIDFPNFVFDIIGLSTNLVENINYGPHKHSHYEFIIVYSGSIEHYIETVDNMEILSVGDIRLVPPQTAHSIKCQKESIHRDILISEKFFEEIAILSNVNKNSIYSKNTLTITDLLDLNRKIIKFNSTHDLAQKRLISIEIFSFLLSIIFFPQIIPVKNKYPPIVNKLLNYFDRPQYLQLSLNKIIEHENYSPIYVSTLFKKHLNTTPTQYLKAKRLEYICYYLKTTSYTLEKICQLVGLDNLSYLHKIFKKEFNMSPSEYRNNYTQG